MATQAARRGRLPREFIFEWEGRDLNGRLLRGETNAPNIERVRSTLRRRGVVSPKIRKRSGATARRIRPKDIALFTRQLATMIKAGVPLLQSFDIVARGNPNTNLTRLLNSVRADVETGTSLASAFRKHPTHFNALYCNLVAARETAGILDNILERLATYLEKTEGIRARIRSALTYPIAVLLVAFIVVALIMVYVVPTFKSVFSSFGANLPTPTLMVIAASEFFVSYWWTVLGTVVACVYLFLQAWRRNVGFRAFMDRTVLRLPIFGRILRKAVIARWTRTLCTMFAAGVPMVDALDSVAGSAGNDVYHRATTQIKREIATGTSLSTAMAGTRVFPSMVLQMSAIGEESGSLDFMLAKAADFYETEVDTAVSNLSTLLEPIVIVFLGVVIGAIVIAMYLPIFRLGGVV